MRAGRVTKGIKIHDKVTINRRGDDEAVTRILLDTPIKMLPDNTEHVGRQFAEFVSKYISQYGGTYTRVTPIIYSKDAGRTNPITRSQRSDLIVLNQTDFDGQHFKQALIEYFLKYIMSGDMAEFSSEVISYVTKGPMHVSGFREEDVLHESEPVQTIASIRNYSIDDLPNPHFVGIELTGAGSAGVLGDGDGLLSGYPDIRDIDEDEGAEFERAIGGIKGKKKPWTDVQSEANVLERLQPSSDARRAAESAMPTRARKGLIGRHPWAFGFCGEILSHLKKYILTKGRPLMDANLCIFEAMTISSIYDYSPNYVRRYYAPAEFFLTPLKKTVYLNRLTEMWEALEFEQKDLFVKGDLCKCLKEAYKIYELEYKVITLTDSMVFDKDDKCCTLLEEAHNYMNKQNYEYCYLFFYKSHVYPVNPNALFEDVVKGKFYATCLGGKESNIIFDKKRVIKIMNTAFELQSVSALSDLKKYRSSTGIPFKDLKDACEVINLKLSKKLKHGEYDSLCKDILEKMNTRLDSRILLNNLKPKINSISALTGTGIVFTDPNDWWNDGEDKLNPESAQINPFFNVMTLDIESTSEQPNNYGLHYPFLICIKFDYTIDGKVMNHAEHYFESVVDKTRKPYEQNCVIDFFKKLVEYVQLTTYHFNKVPFFSKLKRSVRSHGLIKVIAHNGSRFDYRFLIPQMAAYISNPKIIGSYNTIKKIISGCVHWYDLCNIIPASLNGVAESMKIPIRKTDITQDEIINYRENMPKIRDYCMNDVEVLRQCYREFERNQRKSLINGKLFVYPFPHSSANLCMTNFKCCFLSKEDKIIASSPIVNSCEIDSYFGGATCVFNMKAGELPPELNPKPHIAKAPEKRIVYKDINSSYPSVMRYNMPFKYVRTEKYEHILEDLVNGEPLPFDLESNYKITPSVEIVPQYLYMVQWVFKKDVNITNFATRTNDGIVYLKEGIGWLWGAEIINALNFNKLSKLRFYTRIVYEVKRIFKEFIETYYELRKAAKKEGNSVASNTFKLYLNSLYGKFGEKLRRLKEILSRCDIDGLPQNHDEFSAISIYPKNILTITPIGNTAYEVEMDEVAETPMSGMTRFASFITAAARSVLFYGIFIIELFGGTVHYTDTDSMIYSGADLPDSLCDEGILGLWKTEDHIKYARFFGSKTYFYVSTSGVLVMKYKGISRPDLSWKTFKDLIKANYDIELEEEVDERIVSGENITIITRQFTSVGSSIVVRPVEKKVRNTVGLRRKLMKDGSTRPYNNFTEYIMETEGLRSDSKVSIEDKVLEEIRSYRNEEKKEINKAMRDLHSYQKGESTMMFLNVGDGDDVDKFIERAKTMDKESLVDIYILFRPTMLTNNHTNRTRAFRTMAGEMDIATPMTLRAVDINRAVTVLEEIYDYSHHSLKYLSLANYIE